MQLISENFDDGLLIRVDHARIDTAGAVQFKDQMRELTASAPDRILLDLEQVGFVDSSGLGAFVASMKQLKTGQVLELASLTPTVDKVFRLTRMDTVFTIHQSSAALFEGQRKIG